MRPAAGRYRTEQPGIVSWHCFSAGPHYDPDNVAFGPLIGFDEHLVGPGAGFDWHGHRRVHIVSWVLEGTLRHEDATGEVRLIEPGVALVQATAGGVRHAETNASAADPLRFLQLTFSGGDETQAVTTHGLPALVGDVVVDVRVGVGTHVPTFAFALSDTTDHRAGDSLRLVDGMAGPDDGEFLVVEPGRGRRSTVGA